MVSMTLLRILLLPLLLVITAPAPEAFAENIKIGALLGLTGQFAMPGAAFREGAQLGIAEANASGMLGESQLELVIEDTHGDPKTAFTAARKLITTNKVVAAVTMSYPDTKVGGIELQKQKIPSIALWDSSPEIDDMGDYIFALGPWAPGTGEKTAVFAAKELNAKRAVTINTIEEWSGYVAEFFRSKFKESGGKTLGQYEVNPEDSDFRTILAKTKQLKPDVIYAPLTHNLVAFQKQLKQFGIEAAVFSSGVLTQEHINQAPAAFEGIYRSEIKSPDTSISKDLYKTYEKRFGKPVTLHWHVSTGYDAVKLFAKAISEVGPEPEKIKDYMYTIKNYPGAAKSVTISPGGSSPTYEGIFQVQDGKFALIQ